MSIQELETNVPGAKANKPTPRHTEALCLAFTRIFSTDGQEWNLTLREGVTSGQLNQLFTAMEYTGAVAAKHGFAFARQRQAKPKKEGE